MTKFDIQEISEAFRNTSNIDDLWETAFRYFENYGVTSALYAGMSSVTEIEQFGFETGALIKTNHPGDYFDAMGSEKLLSDDYSARALLYDSKPVFWHSDAYEKYMTKDEKIAWELSNDLGMEVGITFSSKLHDQTLVGGIGFCSGHLKAKEFNEMWKNKHSEIIKLFALFDSGARHDHMNDLVKLSPREKQTLEYLCSGFFPSQIADHLNISLSTIDKYIVSSKRKLNAKTRDSAVAKALMFNIINP